MRDGKFKDRLRLLEHRAGKVTSGARQSCKAPHSQLLRAPYLVAENKAERISLLESFN